MKYQCNFILGMNLCYKYNGTDEYSFDEGILC